MTRNGTIKTRGGGASIYYEVDGGEGEPLVLIEGLGYSRWMWAMQRPLAKSAMLVIFDNRGGVGLSSRPRGGPYSMNDFVNDLEDLMNALSIVEAFLWGGSRWAA